MRLLPLVLMGLLACTADDVGTDTSSTTDSSEPLECDCPAGLELREVTGSCQSGDDPVVADVPATAAKWVELCVNGTCSNRDYNADEAANSITFSCPSPGDYVVRWLEVPN